MYASTKALRPVAVAVVVEVHREEGDLGGDVAETEPLVEFDAVEDGDPVLDADVLQMEVAVAVPDPMFGDAPPEKGFLPFQKIPVVGADEFVAAAGDRDPDVGCRLSEVLLVVQADRLHAAEGVDPPSRLGPAVEIGEFGGDGIDDGGITLPLGQEPTEHPLHGEFLHPDGVLDNPPVPVECEPASGLFGYGLDAEVGLRGQPPVQAELLFTVEFPFFQGREVEKAEIDGLLHLVHFVSGDEDEGDMGLDDINLCRLMGVEFRPAHSGIKSRVRHGSLSGDLVATP